MFWALKEDPRSSQPAPTVRLILNLRNGSKIASNVHYLLRSSNSAAPLSNPQTVLLSKRNPAQKARLFGHRTQEMLPKKKLRTRRRYDENTQPQPVSRQLARSGCQGGCVICSSSFYWNLSPCGLNRLPTPCTNILQKKSFLEKT